MAGPACIGQSLAHRGAARQTRWHREGLLTQKEHDWAEGWVGELTSAAENRPSNHISCFGIARFRRSSASLPASSESPRSAIAVPASCGGCGAMTPEVDHDNATVMPAGKLAPIDHPSACRPPGARASSLFNWSHIRRSRLATLARQPAQPLHHGLSGPYVRTAAYEARLTQASTRDSASPGPSSRSSSRAPASASLISSRMLSSPSSRAASTKKLSAGLDRNSSHRLCTVPRRSSLGNLTDFFLLLSSTAYATFSTDWTTCRFRPLPIAPRIELEGLAEHSEVSKVRHECGELQLCPLGYLHVVLELPLRATFALTSSLAARRPAAGTRESPPPRMGQLTRQVPRDRRSTVPDR